MRFATLKRRAEFKRVRGGARWASPQFIIEGKARAGAFHVAAALEVESPGPRFGFTITKKVGGAVVRNRIRRRLKEAIRAIEPQYAKPDHDYVVVASKAVQDYPFAELQDALRAALQRLDSSPGGKPALGRGRNSQRGAGGDAGLAHAKTDAGDAIVSPRPMRATEPHSATDGLSGCAPEKNDVSQ